MKRQFPVGDVLLPVLVAAYAFVVPAFILYSQYKNLPFMASLTFRVDDGWCEPATQGVGSHCFGDFQDVYSRSGTSPWDWVAPFSHPPLSQGFQWTFSRVGEIPGLRQWTLYAWLATSALLLCIPALWAARGSVWTRKAVIFLVIGLGSTPVIATLDRGNSVFLLVVPLLAYVLLLRAHKWWPATGCVVILTCIRPQMILLVLLFLFFGKFWATLKAAGIAILALLAGFFIYPGNQVENLTQWLSNLVSYTDYAPAFTHDGVNLSMFRSVAFFVEFVGTHLDPDQFGGPDSSTAISKLRVVGWAMVSPAASKIYIAVCVLILVLLSIALAKRRSRLALPGAVLLVVILPMILPKTSYIYYSILILVPFSMFLKQVHGEKFAYPEVFAQSRRWITYTSTFLLTLLAVVALVPLAIPLSIILPTQSYVLSNLGGHLVGPVALVTLCAFISILLLPDRMYRQPKQESVQTS